VVDITSLNKIKNIRSYFQRESFILITLEPEAIVDPNLLKELPEKLAFLMSQGKKA
jgi:hypothetical protein